MKLVVCVGKMVHIKCHRKCASSSMLIVCFCVFWQFSTLKGLNSCPLTLTSSGMQLQHFGHDTAKHTFSRWSHAILSNSIICKCKLSSDSRHFNYILHVTHLWFGSPTRLFYICIKNTWNNITCKVKMLEFVCQS